MKKIVLMLMAVASLSLRAMEQNAPASPVNAAKIKAACCAPKKPNSTVGIVIEAYRLSGPKLTPQKKTKRVVPSWMHDAPPAPEKTNNGRQSVVPAAADKKVTFANGVQYSDGASEYGKKS